MANEANNVTLSTNFNVAPYYDDFDESKNYHRILFRPGLAVQARELTQMQTIMQNQIDRFGEHVFKEGSIVSGCSVGIDTNYEYVKLMDKQSDGVTNIVPSLFANTIVRGTTSQISALVINYGAGSQANTPDFNTLFVQYLSSNTTTGYSRFANNEIINVISPNGSPLTANTITSALGGSTGQGSAATISQGIIFAKDHFILVPQQIIILDRYGKTPSYRVGVNIVESIVTEVNDTTLLDPAQGSYNYAAPGAARLKLNPVFQKQNYTSSKNTTEFVELNQVKNGVLQRSSGRPEYAAIRDYLAKRTFDESGHYVVHGFRPKVRSHLKTANNDGVYISAAGGNTSLLVVEASPGVAYVQGYDIERLTTTQINIDKALDTEELDSVKALVDYGNYVIVDNVAGNWDLNQQAVVSLRSQQANAISTGNYSSTNYPSGQLGTARVRGFEYYSGTPGLPNGKYKMYLTDIKMNAGYSFANVCSVGYNGGVGYALGKADIIDSNQKNANTSDSAFNRAIFRLPARAVRRLRNASNIINNDFSFYKSFDVTFDTAGVATINTGDASETFDGSGTLSDSATRTDFYVVSRGSSNTATLTETLTTTSGSNTITASSSVAGKVNPGDVINIHTGGGNRVVSAVSGVTISIFGTASASGGGKAFHKRFLSGQVLDFAGVGASGGNRSITISGSPSTTATVALNEGTIGAALDATVIATLNKIDGQEAAKSISRDRLVQIHINSNRGGSGYTANSTGPWGLGLSDGFRLVSVRTKNGSDFTANSEGSDVTSHFTLDSGMTDSLYDHSKLVKKPSSGLTISNDDRFLVKFDHFTHSTTSGKGYFSIDSYPVNDSTAGTDRTKIYTYQIPRFTSTLSGETFDLRDCIDLRPRKIDTANSVTTVTNIATNPKTSNSFSIVSGGLHFSPPGQDFTTDLSNYMMRVDSVGLTKNGDLIVIRGTPSNRPRTPNIPDDFMPLASIRLTPYPSLPEQVARANSRMDQAVVIKPYKNNRYTMRSIGNIEERIGRLEYYTSLNMLEKDTSSLLVKDENGVDRFKNGFLVDSFTGHNVGNVFDPDYAICIDPKKQEMRAQFKLDNYELFMHAANSSHIVRQNVTTAGVSKDQRLAIANSQIVFANSETITVGSGTAKVVYKVNDRVYVTDCTANFTAGSSIISAAGTTTIYDALGVYDTNPAGNRIAALATLPYSHLVAAHQPYATTSRNISGIAFNWIGTMKLDPSVDYWVDTTRSPEINNNLDLNYDNFVHMSNSWQTQWGVWGDFVYGTPTLRDSATTNGSQYTENGHNWRDDVITENYSQGFAGTRSGIQDVIQENIETQSLGTFVTNTNLQPYMRSRVIEIEIRGMKPGARLYTFFDNVDVSAYVTPTDLGFTPTGAEGSALFVDSAGRVHALFRIPNDENLRFTVGNKMVRLTDSPTNEDDIGLVTTSAESQYSAGGQAQTIQESRMTVRSPVIAQETRSGTQNFTQTITRVNTITVDLGAVPVPQRRDSCGSSIICTKLYQLGLLDETTYLADEMFGAHLRETDPDIYYGYISWAKHVVGWMSGQNPDFMFWIRDPEIRRQVETAFTIKVTEAIARPWAEHMAFHMGMRDTDNKYGKFIMKYGTKVSKLFARTKFGDKKPSLFARYTMIAVFMMLFAGSRITDKLSAKKTNKVWGSA